MWNVYDTIEWIGSNHGATAMAGMVGASSCSASKVLGAATKPPHLFGLRLDECMTGIVDYSRGIFDTIWYHIPVGRHGNDSFFCLPNYLYAPMPPRRVNHADIGAKIREALEHPDIK